LTARRAAWSTLSAATKRGTSTTKKCFENVAEPAATKWIATTATTANTRLTELVVSCFLLWIGEHLVSARHFFEFCFCLGIARVGVWVQFARTLAPLLV
jgi:hypothetical protein